MEMYLKRFFWIVPIVVVVFCSLLAARAANHILEAAVLLPLDAKTKAKPRVSRPKHKIPDEPATLQTKDEAAVAARNLFCSSCDPAAAKPVEPNTPAPTVGSGVPLTSAPIGLLGTLVASEPALSTATIMNITTLRTGSYRVGERIPTVGVIQKIRPKYVDFTNDSTGRLERVELAGLVASASPPPPPPPPAVPSPLANPVPPPPVQTPDADLLAEMDKSIKKVDDTHYEIDRGLVEKVMADPNLVARSARIVPSIKDGKANGFKVYAIRPNSAFAKLGLQNGDTMQMVNGFEVTGFDKALEVLSKIRGSSNLSVQILRRGQPVTMEYTIK